MEESASAGAAIITIIYWKYPGWSTLRWLVDEKRATGLYVLQSRVE